AFAAESVVYAVVGLADHPGTDSVRMESAISKYYATESLVEITSAAEALVGPESHVAPNDLEKKKRDGRIMTIYEGTNQVQRYGILRHLLEDVLPRWPVESGRSPTPGTGLAAECQAAIARGKQDLRGRLERAASDWGERTWRNPNNQAVFFPLSEIAARLFCMESVLQRAAWVSRHAATLGEEYVARVEA